MYVTALVPVDRRWAAGAGLGLHLQVRVAIYGHSARAPGGVVIDATVNFALVACVMGGLCAAVGALVGLIGQPHSAKAYHMTPAM